jgi:hypothetical protein
MKAYKHQKTYIFLIGCCFLLVLIVASRLGDAGRVMITAAPAVTVMAQAQAAIHWEKAGVRGRTLLLFDSYPHMRGLAFYDNVPSLTNANFVEYSIFKNIVRRIYLIVADDQWHEFAARRDIGVFRAIQNGRAGFYLFTMSGVPLVAVPESGVPKIDETVLVYVNNGLFPTDRVSTLLKTKNIQSDIVLTCQGGCQ